MSGSLSTWLTAVLVFAAVGSAVVSLVLLLEWVRERRSRTLLAEQLKKLDETGLQGGTGAVDILRASREQGIPWLQPLASKVPHVRDIDNLLQQAAMTWTVQTFLLYTFGFAVAFGLGAAMITGFGVWAITAAALGASLPTIHVRRKRTKRMHAFEAQLPEAVDLVGRAIRAGHPLSAGFKMVAEEMPDPVSGEFRQVFEEQRFGLHFEDSLLGMADRVPILDLRILITAMLIQREVGGNLAEVLDKIAYVIRERFTIRRQMRVITAEARMSMWVLLALPPGVALLIFVMNPGYILTLFQSPMGHTMLYASVVMQFLGYLWIRKIVNIEI